MGIILNINDLHTPIKRQIEKLDKKQDLDLYSQQEACFKHKDTDKLKVRGRIVVTESKSEASIGQQQSWGLTTKVHRETNKVTEKCSKSCW